MDVISVLRSILEDLTDAPDVPSLREIRRILDDPALLWALQEHMRQINDPERLADTINLVNEIKRLVEERAEDRKYSKEQVVQIGVVGGIGLIGGTIVAAASSVAPFIVLVPVLGGAVMSGIGFFGGRRLNLECTIYSHLADRMATIVLVLPLNRGGAA